MRNRTLTRLQREFDLNAPNLDLHEVMVSQQNASLSFQTLVHGPRKARQRIPGSHEHAGMSHAP